MPIHDQGYRHYSGERSVLGRRWVVIVRAGVRTMFGKKPFIGLLLLAWIPFLLRGGQIYFSTSVPQAAALLKVSPATFLDFLGQQSLWVFFITVYVGSGLIANDRRANALQIYLSKPLTRTEYIFGKLSVLMLFLLLVTAVPGLLLLLLQILFTGDLTFFRENSGLLPAIALFSFVQALTFASTMLALSSLSRSSRYVAILYAAVIFLSQGIYGVLRQVTGTTSFAWVSLPANMTQIGSAIFRLPLQYTTPWPASLGVVAGLIAVSGLILERRVRGVEIVHLMDAIIAADHVSKWYGQVIGLNDVSLTVPPGITGLLGPNGAGKSTFMKLITGQLKASKGAISVLGESIWGNPALYARIGFCPEQDTFYERMTGLEWVTALVRLNGVSDQEADAMARRALDVVDLADAAGKKIGAYSKGMRQRVKMAQALAHDPELLILDEPLSGMDPIARRKMIRVIRDWGQSGKSVLVSSHILHEIESMTSNILLVNQGRILAEGNIHQIRDLIDEHPHTVHIRADDPRALARAFLSEDDVLSLTFEDGAVVVQTVRPDGFYSRLTALAASGELGAIHEVTSPDDNLQAVFEYLVKS